MAWCTKLFGPEWTPQPERRTATPPATPPQLSLEVRSQMKALRDDFDKDWHAAGDRLKAARHEATVDALIALVEADDRYSSQASVTLQHIGEWQGFDGLPRDRAIAALLRALRKHGRLAEPATIALGGLKAAQAVGDLVETLDVDGLRFEAIKSLGLIADSRAVDALVRLLDDGRRWLVSQAAEALGHIGDAKPIDALLRVSTNVAHATTDQTTRGVVRSKLSVRSVVLALRPA